VHSAATVLAFLQRERGLLRPGHTFRPIARGDATDVLAADQKRLPSEGRTLPTARAMDERSDPASDLGISNN